MAKHFLGIVLIGLHIFSSCKNENIIPANTIDEFPNEVGNHWRYLYIWDANQQHRDTMDVDIVGTRVLSNGQTAKVWAYKVSSSSYPIKNDTNYVVSDSQKVTIFMNMYGTLYEKKHYELPLTVGNVWAMPQQYKDTIWVVSKDLITVPAGTFNDANKLRHEQKPHINSWINDDIWLAPQVGLVKLSQFQYNLGGVFGNGYWELISYNVK